MKTKDRDTVESPKGNLFKCDVCGEVYDRSFLDQVVVHMHEKGSEDLAKKVKGIRGKRVE